MPNRSRSVSVEIAGVEIAKFEIADVWSPPAVKLFQTRRRAPGWPAMRMLFWWTLVRGLILLFFSFVYRIRREGAEHIPRTGPIIYVANHQSHFDPPIVGVLVTDRPFSGMARSGLFKSKILAWIMRGIGAIELEQGKGDAGAMKAALAELEAGRSMLIFPEGTRTRSGTIEEFQRGVMLLIKRSRAQVVPVALEGAFDIWPIGTKFPKFSGRIGVKAGPALSTDELLAEGPDAGLERLRSQIETMRLELRRHMRQATKGRFPAASPGDRPYWQRTMDPTSGASESLTPCLQARASFREGGSQRQR